MTRTIRTLLIVGAFIAAPPRAPAQQATANPHGELKEPCASCHSANAWTPAHVSKKFKHAPKIFPLDGAHGQTNCRACHATLDFKGVSPKCATCHKDVHQGELGPDCARCHSPRSFIDRAVMMQRHQTTRFPLTGAHVMADCLSCHPPVAQGHMTFVGRPVECVACHLPAYASTANPPHQTAGFPTTCETCHTTVIWNLSGFNHAASRFPLTGAHAATPCNVCHKNNRFTGLSAVCVSCHLPDYNGTNAPPHAAAGFATTCADCHSTTTWAGASFDHDGRYFPIYSGAHQNRWSTCVTCHTSPTSYVVFSCVNGCHAKATTDSHHQGNSGYRYDSQACYSCHPRGSTR